MKKNISINISGIIFHIEEDGYEVLRKYLDSINKYFSSYEDSSEILADIESRIAEILLAKLNEGKQVIIAEDITTLMTTMGSVSDFKAAEEAEAEGQAKKSNGFKSSATSESTTPSKKLFRDQKRKILGGVCAGLAHYFNIDPVWIRLLFLLLIFGSYGGLFLVYIILWIVLPGSDILEEESSLKKMYRDQENKVVGGVASGVAAFFGADIALIRVLFVLLAFVGGVGLIAYLILWIALPEAKTITEKMRMQGEAVTLSNIESSVKKNINEKEGDEESTLAKIILFPFRAIAAVLSWLAKIIGPIFNVLVDIFRVGFGIIISLVGISFLLSILLAAGIVLGFFSFDTFWWGSNELGLPMEAFRNSFPSWTVFFGFVAAIIPALFVTLIGTSVLAKKIVFNATFGWSMFVLFFVSIVALGFTIPQIAYSFKEEGERKIEKMYNITGTPVIRISEIGLDDYDMTSLRLKGTDEANIKLVQRFEAQGGSRKIAIENTEMVDYMVSQEDSILTFDSNITFQDDAKFRAQRLTMDLFIPYDKPFIVEENAWHIIDNYERYRFSDYRNQQTWKLTPDGLECLTCPVRERDRELGLHDEYGFTDFDQIELRGLFDVRIIQSESYGIEIEGPTRLKNRYDVTTEGHTLVIEYNDRNEFFWRNNVLREDEMKITISLPSITDLDIVGAGTLRMRGFDEDDLDIKIVGAMKADCDLNANNLTLDMTGATIMDLTGEGNFMEADITGASSLRAYSYKVKNGRVEAHGASSAKVFVSERLEIRKGIASKVSHRGDPEIIRYE